MFLAIGYDQVKQDPGHDFFKFLFGLFCRIVQLEYCQDRLNILLRTLTRIIEEFYSKIFPGSDLDLLNKIILGSSQEMKMDQKRIVTGKKDHL